MAVTEVLEPIVWDYGTGMVQNPQHIKYSTESRLLLIADKFSMHEIEQKLKENPTCYFTKSCLLLTAEKLGMHEIKRKLEENPTCYLPLITDKILSMPSTVESAQQLEQLDPVTLFSIIQEAHNLKKKELMDLACCTLANKVQTKEIVEFNIDQEYAHSKCSKRLRSHKRETFIKTFDVFSLDCRPALSGTTKMIMNELTSPEEKLETADVEEFMESSKFVVCDTVCRDFKKLNKATERLHNLICEDSKLAHGLSYNVVERLVRILDTRDLDVCCVDTLYLAVYILSIARYHKCSNLIKEQAIPFLVKLMKNRFNQLAGKVVITLARLACTSSDYLKVIIDNGALEVAQEIVAKSTSGFNIDIKCKCAMFLAVVCRASRLSPEKEKVVTTIVEDLFEKDCNTPSTKHINRACYALSYLSYAKPVDITKKVCEWLVKFLSHDDKLVVASALGVVGNVVRWGYAYQIQCLTEDFQLVECLGKSMLCSKFKLFRKEACQIISNLAVRSKTSIKDEASLIKSLCQLLEKDESDVKMEAAWAIFNNIYAF